MSTMESLKQTGKSFWRWTKMTFYLLVLVGILTTLFFIFANYSDGTRTGYITKVSRKGYIFKTYEGELNTGFFGNTPMNGKPMENVWYFSVSNKDVADQIQKASETGQKTTLHYKQKYVKLFFRGDTEYFVWKVDGDSEVKPLPPAQ